MLTGDAQLDPVARELRAGERVLWQGQPLESMLFSPEDVFLIPASLLWGGFALFWESMAVGIAWQGSTHPSKVHGPAFIPYIFPLWGLMFVCVGLYAMFGRFFHLRRAKRNTWYAITDKRVIIISHGIITGHRVKEKALSGIDTLERTLRNNGAGTVRFGEEERPLFTWGYRWPVQKLTTAFVDIADVETVYALLETARTRA